MPLAPLDFLASIVAPGLAPDLCGLYRLTVDTRSAGGGLSPRFPAHPLPQGSQYLGPGPIITPLCKIVIDAAFRQQVMRQHLPLAATPIQIQERIEDLSHIKLPGPTSLTGAGRWKQGF